MGAAASTTVVSELMRDKPDPRVLAWATELGATAVTDRWHEILDAYAGSLLVYDVPAAQAAAGALAVRARRATDDARRRRDRRDLRLTARDAGFA